MPNRSQFHAGWQMPRYALRIIFARKFSQAGYGSDQAVPKREFD
jgi:hypothetical protein